MLTGRSQSISTRTLGVIENGAYARHFVQVVDGNPLEDITVIGANKEWFRPLLLLARKGIESIKLIMKDGRKFTKTLLANRVLLLRVRNTSRLRVDRTSISRECSPYNMVMKTDVANSAGPIHQAVMFWQPALRLGCLGGAIQRRLSPGR